MWCPRCGSEYVEGITSCSDCGEMLVHEPPRNEPEPVPRAKPTHSHDDVETALLGRFDQLEVPIVLQMLEEEGIFAMTAAPMDSPTRSWAYGLPTGADQVLVEKACLEQALRLCRERLPEIVAAMGSEEPAE